MRAPRSRGELSPMSESVNDVNAGTRCARVSRPRPPGVAIDFVAQRAQLIAILGNEIYNSLFPLNISIKGKRLCTWNT